MPNVDVRVHATGPFFNDLYRRGVIDRMIADIQTEVAQQAYANVRQLMDTHFKNPTPYYETQVTVERQADDVVVHDRGIVYGPWLEGVSSRNQTTRFKGYGHWRQATEETRRDVPRLADHVARRYTAKLD